MASSINVDRQRKQRKNLSLEDKIDIIRRKEANAISQQKEVHIEEDSSEEEEETISIKIGREALETAKQFLEQREFTTEEDIKYIRDIIRRLDESVEKSKRQTLLTEYISQ